MAAGFRGRGLAILGAMTRRTRASDPNKLRLPSASAVEVSRPDPDVWQQALTYAAGNVRRIKQESPTRLLVLNQPIR